jgi:hypothetical protein
VIARKKPFLQDSVELAKVPSLTSHATSAGGHQHSDCAGGKQN